MSDEQFKDLTYFISSRKSDIELGMENFGALESLLNIEQSAPKVAY